MKTIISLRNTIGSTFAALSLAVISYNRFFFRPIHGVIACVLIILALFILNKCEKDYDIELSKVARFIIFTWAICVIAGIVQGTDNFLKLPQLENLLYAGLMTYILCSFRVWLLPFKVVMYSSIVYLYYVCFVVGISFFEIFVSGAGGGITILLLSIAIPIQLLDYRDNRRIDLLPSLLIIPLAVYGWSRTGLVASLVFLFTLTIFGIGQISKQSTKIILFIVIIGVLTYLITRYWFLLERSDIYSKIDNQEGAMDWSGRDNIWLSYFEHINIISFLFGIPLDNTHQVAGFSNMHNSFLMLHSQTGLFGLFLIFYFLKVAFKYLKTNVFILSLYLVLLLRSVFDMVYFFSMFDFAFFMFLLGQESFITKQEDIQLRLI